MDSDSNEVHKKILENTMRCPKCGWVSVTKIADSTPFIGLMMHPIGDHFLCTNPQCGVERIYGENCVIIREGKK